MYRGIFWITTLDDLDNNRAFVLIPCDGNGIPDGVMDLNSRGGTNMNHKRTWESFPSDITNSKPYNYYPRGRVEIRKGGKVIIYMNPHICTPDIIGWVIKKFELDVPDDRIVVKADGSRHYKCHLDQEAW